MLPHRIKRWQHPERPSRQASGNLAAFASSDAFELRADVLDIVLAGRGRLYHGHRRFLRNAGKLTLLAVSEADKKPPVIRSKVDGFDDF